MIFHDHAIPSLRAAGELPFGSHSYFRIKFSLASFTVCSCSFRVSCSFIVTVRNVIDLDQLIFDVPVPLQVDYVEYLIWINE